MIIKHPLFPEIRRDVEDSDRWIAAGWVPVDPPSPPRPKPKPRRRNRRHG